MRAKMKSTAKWIAAIAMATALMLCLTACASGQDASSSESSPSNESSPSGPTAAEPEAQSDATQMGGEFGNAVVVYFTGTGNTEKVADYIAQDTGASTFQITPEDPYTMEDLDWTTDSSRVNQEHDDSSLRDVPLTTTEVPNWDSYDTVFIGYPIWWGIAAWPVDSFVSANDFTGKTVIPFCTSTSSPLGESAQLIADLAGTDDWVEGHRFSQIATAEDVSQWLESL